VLRCPTFEDMERVPAVDACCRRLGGQEQDTLAARRERCLELLDPFIEAIRCGMPCDSRDDERELAFSTAKHHLALDMMRGDLHLVGDLVHAVGAERGPIC
jgi:hypothetical protein